MKRPLSPADTSKKTNAGKSNNQSIDVLENLSSAHTLQYCNHGKKKNTTLFSICTYSFGSYESLEFVPCAYTSSLHFVNLQVKVYFMNRVNWSSWALHRDMEDMACRVWSEMTSPGRFFLQRYYNYPMDAKNAAVFLAYNREHYSQISRALSCDTL